MSNINIDLLASRLNENLSDCGIKSDFYISAFNQYIQEMISPESVLKKENFDFAILFLDGEELFREIINSPFKFKEDEIGQIIDQEIKNLRVYLESGLQANSRLTFFINNIFIRKPTILGALDYNAGLTIAGIQDFYNSRIKELKISERVVIVNFVSLSSRYGHETIYDNRLWYIGRIKLSNQGLQLLSELYSMYMLAYLGKRKKVLILDLDNTLWGGIIGEDGIDGIKLGEDGIGRAYLDFQKLIKGLKHKGVLLAICSKNNPEDVKEVFDRHKFMELKEDDFVALRVNWGNKIKNIKELSTILNLGLDSFVFIDDNPFERQLVKSELPQVIVPDFPSDPVNLSQWIIDLSFKYFNNTTITKEDKLRTALYQADAKRKELEKSTVTLEDFYKSLEMTTIIKTDNHADFKRIAQLTQRTNQFNLTTKRYSENQILDFMDSQNCKVLSLELNDRFGSNGIVGVLIAKIDGEKSYIDTFLLSCRVIGRMVEDTFLSYLTKVLKDKGVETLIGEYIPTKKNLLVMDLYKKFGFKLIEEKEDKSTLWEFDLIQGMIEGNKWVKIETA